MQKVEICMSNKTLGNCKSIDEFVDYKIEKLINSDKTFESIFNIMVLEKSNTFCEENNGYKITKTTYAEFEKKVYIYANSIANTFSNIDQGSLIGMYMQNSEAWIEIFWALLMSGYKPVLLNTRMNDELLLSTIENYDIKKIITDEDKFSNKGINYSNIIDNAKEDIGDYKPSWDNEIMLMSSGTTNNVKLCVYTGEQIHYQILDSSKIIKECFDIKKHYNDELKLLTFLPFYHIFGLFAVYIWFSFFSRTFVFLKDFAPNTILNTIKRHKVTHVFAVPLLWNTIYKQAISTIKGRGEKTYQKFLKGVKISEKLYNNKPLYKFFAKKSYKEIRENIFGDTISFLISGGSVISNEVLSFFNNIGYHLANGYGMTELGITSFEISETSALVNGSIGKPFSSVEYMINDEGELLVRGKTLASKVYQDGKIVKDDDDWFNTHDIAKEIDGHYYLYGRKDDVVVSQNGENLNPNIIEPQFNIDRINDLGIVSCNNNGNTIPTLIISVSPLLTKEKYQGIYKKAQSEIERLNLKDQIGKIVLVSDNLMDENDFKLNRISISNKLSNNQYHIIDIEKASEDDSVVSTKVKEIMANTLHIEKDNIKGSDNFFTDLGGTSLDYISLIMSLQDIYNITFPMNEGNSLSSVDELSKYIIENG